MAENQPVFIPWKVLKNIFLLFTGIPHFIELNMTNNCKNNTEEHYLALFVVGFLDTDHKS